MAHIHSVANEASIEREDLNLTETKLGETFEVSALGVYNSEKDKANKQDVTRGEDGQDR